MQLPGGSPAAPQENNLLLEGADKERGSSVGAMHTLGDAPCSPHAATWQKKKEDFHFAARVGTGMLLEVEQAGDGQAVACLAKQGSPMQPSQRCLALGFRFPIVILKLSSSSSPPQQAGEASSWPGRLISSVWLGVKALFA